MWTEAVSQTGKECSLCVRGLEEGEFFREKEEHAQIKRQKVIFRARQSSRCVNTLKVFIVRRNGQGGKDRWARLCLHDSEPKQGACYKGQRTHKA